ncbi:hypothetical protein V8C35DRAFT_266469 [Trichoderma chlorosporum]
MGDSAPKISSPDSSRAASPLTDGHFMTSPYVTDPYTPGPSRRASRKWQSAHDLRVSLSPVPEPSAGFIADKPPAAVRGRTPRDRRGRPAGLVQFAKNVEREPESPLPETRRWTRWGHVPRGSSSKSKIIHERPLPSDSKVWPAAIGARSSNLTPSTMFRRDDGSQTTTLVGDGETTLLDRNETVLVGVASDIQEMNDRAGCHSRASDAARLCSTNANKQHVGPRRPMHADQLYLAHQIDDLLEKRRPASTEEQQPTSTRSVPSSSNSSATSRQRSSIPAQNSPQGQPAQPASIQYSPQRQPAQLESPQQSPQARCAQPASVQYSPRGGQPAQPVFSQRFLEKQPAHPAPGQGPWTSPPQSPQGQPAQPVSSQSSPQGQPAQPASAHSSPQGQSAQPASAQRFPQQMPMQRPLQSVSGPRSPRGQSAYPVSAPIPRERSPQQGTSGQQCGSSSNDPLRQHPVLQLETPPQPLQEEEQPNPHEVEHRKRLLEEASLWPLARLERALASQTLAFVPEIGPGNNIIASNEVGNLGDVLESPPESQHGSEADAEAEAEAEAAGDGDGGGENAATSTSPFGKLKKWFRKDRSK